ncbi:PREDICTED: protein DOG1-like 3 [Ipomoea nil]|uniref:protein DOG1-like 3 n=1 Tax=Ipomoea nil TaxID=35883 RepID=UPI0009011387|nr:PREDICTED: protein DOG1-like 3 [Ipomoea nil]
MSCRLTYDLLSPKPPSFSIYLDETKCYFVQYVCIMAESEGFQKFFEFWLVEQKRDLEQLVSAVKTHRQDGRSSTNQAGEDNHNHNHLRPLIQRVLNHYEHYYKVKSRYEKRDIIAMLTPSWRSKMEDAFMWIGGWRPSMAFHLLYSKSGLQLEPRLSELLSGLRTGDLGDLSPDQLTLVDELQRKTIREENELVEKHAQVQESVADASMVEWSHMVTELTRAGDETMEEHGLRDEQVASALAPKEKAMVDILQKADDLRLSTLKEMVNILNLIQAAHFLIAAAELHLRFHEWGMKRDAAAHHHA